MMDMAETREYADNSLPEDCEHGLRMPVMDGIEATGIIKEQFPQIQVNGGC